jgi:hypothetical protein
MEIAKIITIAAVCCVYGLLIVLLLSPSPAGAQAPAATAAELPAMVLKVCFKLEDAKNQADMSFQFANVQKPVRIEPKFLSPGCWPMPVIARVRSDEPSIRPFETWAPTYDPDGSTIVEARHDGVTYKVPLSLRKQRVRFVLADLMVPVDADDHRIAPQDRGKWFPGWLELPDAPYLSTYLERRKP